MAALWITGAALTVVNIVAYSKGWISELVCEILSGAALAMFALDLFLERHYLMASLFVLLTLICGTPLVRVALRVTTPEQKDEP